MSRRTISSPVPKIIILTKRLINNNQRSSMLVYINPATNFEMEMLTLDTGLVTSIL
ncbi:hypothetical protein ASZ90_005369 [hydrocarbon metagenome]|uniref:Uncharacterized protein n=1 Tax=hydrocarbon metagenome TaxID=938273 RepID=A0A0W8FVR2_9ZZZZ